MVSTEKVIAEIKKSKLAPFSQKTLISLVEHPDVFPMGSVICDLLEKAEKGELK